MRSRPQTEREKLARIKEEGGEKKPMYCMNLLSGAKKKNMITYYAYFHHIAPKDNFSGM